MHIHITDVAIIFITKLLTNILLKLYGKIST